MLKIYNAFQSLRIPIRPLTNDETISYLHSTVSDNPRKKRVPAHPLILDKYMYDTPLYGGLEPRLNKNHIRVIVPLKYPKATIFGFLDVLNRLDFSYRWSTRCYCMSKNDTLSVLTSLRKAWKSKLQSSIYHKADKRSALLYIKPQKNCFLISITKKIRSKYRVLF